MIVYIVNLPGTTQQLSFICDYITPRRVYDMCMIVNFSWLQRSAECWNVRVHSHVTFAAVHAPCCVLLIVSVTYIIISRTYGVIIWKWREAWSLPYKVCMGTCLVPESRVRTSCVIHCGYFCIPQSPIPAASMPETHEH